MGRARALRNCRAAWGLLVAVVLSSSAALAYNGQYSPALSVTVANNHLVNRPGDITIDLTQPDQQQPTVVIDVRIPGGWQFPMSSLRAGQKADGTPATECKHTVDNVKDGTNSNARFARAEKIGTGFAQAAADGITRPGPPAQYNGDLAFISWDAATQTANLCLLLITTDTRVSTFQHEDVESFTEVIAEFPVRFTTLDGAQYWQVYADINDLYADELVQTINLSVTQLRTTIKAASTGNWNASPVNVAVNPATSGDMAFVGVFTSNDARTVTQTIPITIALPAPTLTSPANGSAFNTSVVTLGGTSDPNASVAVYDGGVDVAHVTADGSGIWSAPLLFADGSHTVLVRTIDAGGQSDPSAARSFLVDTTPPAAPILLTPADTATIGGTTVSVTGTAEPSSVVRVYEGLDLRATTTATTAGSWATNVVLPKGVHQLAANATDALGNTGPQSLPTTFDVTTATPVIASPRQNRIVGRTDVTFLGTAEPGATVRLTENDVEILSAVADTTGKWTGIAVLSETTHTVVGAATATDGFVSLPTEPRTFKIDTSTPPPPEIISPAAEEIVATNAVTLIGTAASDSTIVVREGDLTVGQTLSDENGDWTMNIVLDRGTHVLRTTSIDDRGAVESGDHVLHVAAALPHITGPAAGGWQKGTFTLTGSADETASEVRVYNGAAQVASAPVAPDGTWSLAVTFPSGIVNLSARTVTGGTLSPPSEVHTYSVDAIAPSLIVLNPTTQIAIMLPNQKISGTSRDMASVFDSKVAGIEVTYADATGLAAPVTLTASCVGCPGGNVSWTSLPEVAPGLYDVTVAVLDRAGNRTSKSFTAIIV